MSKVREQVVGFLAAEPSAWFGSADALLKSAALVWAERRRLHNSAWVALMMRAYAVENLLKGLLAQGGKISVVGGEVQVLRTHDLPRLAAMVGIACSSATTSMLRALTAAMSFLGRYPVPLRCDDMPIHSPEQVDAAGSWSADSEREFWDFVDAVASRFTFLTGLPSGFLDEVLRGTWRRPAW